MDTLPHGPVRAPATDPGLQRAERRRHARTPVVWMATLRTKVGFYGCLVIDISKGGAKLAISDGPALEPGEPVRLDLSPFGTFGACAVWQRAGYTGIRFIDPPESIVATIGGAPSGG